jgi:hypothetical protein
MESAVLETRLEGEISPRGIVPILETKMCWAALSSSHQREKAAISVDEGFADKTGSGAGVISGRFGSIGADGSKIWPNRPFARSEAVTPSSQAKKSNLFVRVEMCETEGKSFEIEEEVEEVEDGGTQYMY